MVYLLLLACGAFSGFCAGLLGIGGGFVVVPVLQLLLPALGVDAGQVPTVAVATSLAAMVPTAMSAVLAQHRSQALRAEWVRLLAPGVAFGAALGSVGARNVDGLWLTALFALYAAYFATRLLRQSFAARAPVARRNWIATLPQWSVGLVIGGVSALAGVGGASLVVPYLLQREAQLRQAAAAASAIGLVSAVVGATTFGLASGEASAAPCGMIGLVYWPAAFMIGAAALALAPLGVIAAEYLPAGRLRQAFAMMLAGVAVAAATRVAVQF